MDEKLRESQETNYPNLSGSTMQARGVLTLHCPPTANMSLSHAGTSIMRAMENGSSDNPAFRPIMQIINIKPVGGQDRFRVSALRV